MIVYIYALSDNEGIKYIGKSIKPKERFKSHLYNSCQKGNKEYWYRKSIWIREKREEILQIILEECNDYNWIEREIYWIEYYSKIRKLMNQTVGGAGIHGYKKTSEQIQRAKDGKKKLKHTEETRKKMSESRKGIKTNWVKGTIPWNKGKSWSEEIIEKLRISHLGQKCWNEGKPELMPSMKGKKHSPETIALFKEQRKNISDEHRRNMSESAKKKIVTPETRERMRTGVQKWWDNRKKTA